MNESQLFSCQESGAPDTYNKPPYSSPYSSSSYQEMLKQHAERMQVMNDISRSTGGALTAAPPASVAVTAPVTSLAFGTPSPMLHSTPQEKDNINIGSPNLFTAARQSSRKDGYGKTMTVCLCGSPDASQRQWTRSSGPCKSVCGVRSSSSKLSLYRSQGERTPDKLSTQPQPQQSQQGKSMLSLSCSCSSPLAQEQQGGEGGNEQQQQQQQQYLNVDNGGGEGEEEECDDEDVVMDGSEVKYAPLKWIIDTLLSQTTDTQFVQDFVLTMNLFMTPEELLATLVKKFYEPVPPNVIPSEIENYVKTVQNQEKIRIFLIIEKWVDSTWNSATDPALVQAVRNFIDGTNMTISASKLNRLINKRIVNEETKSMTTYANDPPAPRIVPFIESDAPAPVISLFTTSVSHKQHTHIHIHKHTYTNILVQ